MTAIAGLWSFDGAMDAGDNCSLMLNALSMYGSSHRAQYAAGQVALGCCLSRLLPEDRFDSQPLSGESVSALVADVRLDNRAELARNLKIPNAAEIADSAILLAAWRAWGEHCADRFSGAFAFAVWDERQRHLFVARDHVGERPLYYFLDDRCVAFASMPKGLHPLPFIGAEVDEDYVARYLALVNSPVERTIFRRILRLPAGCAVSFRPGKTRLWKYWQPEQLPELRLGSDEEYLDLLRERMDEAVRSRLRTTGGIGTQLSGGLDSSSVAATAARLLGADGRELTAYTAVPRPGFPSASNSNHFDDEGPAAAEVAALYPNMRHMLVDSSASNFLDVLDLNASLYDHPCYAPTNEVWSNAIMSRAQENGITVLLNGYCGNSTFSFYGMPVLSAWLRSGHWATLARVGWQIKKAGSASVKSILRNALWPSLPFWLRKATDPHMRHFSLDYCALHPEIKRQLDLERRALHDLNAVPASGRSLLSTLLQYGDISENSIAPQAGWGLDFRDPTFDRRVVEFCLTVPLEQFVRGGQLRSLARRSMAGRLPPNTLNRKQRGRQAADWYISVGALRGRMMAEIERFQHSPIASRMLDLARMRRLIENWPTSGFDRIEIQGSYHVALTRGLSVGCFLTKFDRQ